MLISGNKIQTNQILGILQSVEIDVKTSGKDSITLHLQLLWTGIYPCGTSIALELVSYFLVYNNTYNNPPNPKYITFAKNNAIKL